MTQMNTNMKKGKTRKNRKKHYTYQGFFYNSLVKDIHVVGKKLAICRSLLLSKAVIAQPLKLKALSVFIFN